MRIKPFRSSVDVGGTRLISYCRTGARAVIAAVTAADIGARMAAGVGADGRRNDLHWLDKHLNNTFEASGQGVRQRQSSLTRAERSDSGGYNSDLKF